MSRHNVSVSVRIRPPSGPAGVTAGERGLTLRNGISFDYPAAVIQGSDQGEAMECLAGRLVRKFCDGGLNCTLMAYGQTGSGKTHTMFGPPGSLTETALKEAGGSIPKLWGVFPRVMLELLESPELSGATFHASAIEIYMEHAYDLLAGRSPVKVGSVRGAGRGTIVVADISKGPVYSGHSVIVGGLHPASCTCFKCFNEQRKASSAKAKPRAGPSPSSSKKATGGDEEMETFGTEGETLWPLQSPSDVAKLTRLVESERVAHGHALNARSSRSHCLIRLHCTHVKGGKSEKRLFLFVDLAGSERIAKSEVVGARQKEASNINMSLTTLGRVVKELSERKSHVSYRDSTLTMLLRASFSGPSCTSVVINVSGEEEHSEETLCSLKFGGKLSGVQTSAVAMKAVDVDVQRERVGAELKQAKARLEAMKCSGHGDRISESAPPSEQTSLRINMQTLAERTSEVRVLKTRLVEAKAKGNADTIEGLTTKLEGALFSQNNIRDIVERQKTIPGLFVPATPAYSRMEAHVAALAGQMEVLGV